MCAAFDQRGHLRQLTLGGLNPRATMPIAPKAQREAYRYLIRQLDAYFIKTLRTFTVPLDPVGSPFENHVWDAIQGIPYGQTVSLQEFAFPLGDETPVLEAILANPIAILIPCHRILGPDSAPLSPWRDALLRLEGSLTGGSSPA